MKTTAVSLFLAAIGLCSCKLFVDPVDVAKYHWDQRHPLPEADWNSVGLWRRISEKPAEYIPRDYPNDAPRTDANGEWIEDNRDKKRFYIPSGGAGGISEQVLRSDALKNSRAMRPVPIEEFFPD